MPKDYDVIIIGAGLSGLAAGIRLAHFERKVAIFESHTLPGGLNSFFKRNGRVFDTGLHAMTNFVGPGIKDAPLNKLLRQLRLRRADLELCEPEFSSISFPGAELHFSNNLADLEASIAATFPQQIDGFRRLVSAVREYDALAFQEETLTARTAMARWISEPVLIDMLLCPVMFYGCYEEDDMNFRQFAILFQSVFLEGFARPHNGIRGFLKILVDRYRNCGGELNLGTGVRRILTERGRAVGVELIDGRQLTATAILSSAGYIETLGMCDPSIDPGLVRPGRLTFTETIFALDCLPRDLGCRAAITFFNQKEFFDYRCPHEIVDLSSGVLCCPENFADCAPADGQGTVRISRLANYQTWLELTGEDYSKAKQEIEQQQLVEIEKMLPGVSSHVVFSDTFTPRTITRYTGHIHGAIYGAVPKQRDGRTPIDGLFICGTDQGYLGIIGALLSGVSMANLHFIAQR